MRVRVSYVIEADDNYRRAITCAWGEHGRKATRAEVQAYAERVGSANDDDLFYEYDECEVCHPKADQL